MGSVDWTVVIVAVIAAVPACLSAYWSRRTNREIKTPSGEPLGTVTEKTLDLSSADVALTTGVHRVVVGGESQPDAQSRQQDLDEGTGPN